MGLMGDIDKISCVAGVTFVLESTFGLSSGGQKKVILLPANWHGKDLKGVN